MFNRESLTAGFASYMEAMDRLFEIFPDLDWQSGNSCKWSGFRSDMIAVPHLLEIPEKAWPLVNKIYINNGPLGSYGVSPDPKDLQAIICTAIFWINIPYEYFTPSYYTTKTGIHKYKLVGTSEEVSLELLRKTWAVSDFIKNSKTVRSYCDLANPDIKAKYTEGIQYPFQSVERWRIEMTKHAKELDKALEII